MWDITTLLMYIYKIWKIGTFYKIKDEDIWNNILSILHRVVTITLFYQITAFLLEITLISISLIIDLKNNPNIKIGFFIQSVVSSSILSLSIYLMMEHNTSTYVAFLQFLRKFRLHCLCLCCCRGIVDQQLETLNSKMDSIHDENEKKSPQTEFTNISADAVYFIPFPKKSVETPTEIISTDCEL